MTVKQVAEKLAVSPRYVRMLIAAGRFPNVRKAWNSSNSPWLIPASDLENYLKQKRAGQG